MILTFLGTGSGAPSTKRNVSATALTMRKTGKWWLFDCGEGTQHQILHSPLRVSQLEKIFITHMHGDHLFGLIGLLASRSLQARVETPIQLYGPRALQQYIEAVMAVSPIHLQYPLTFHPVTPGIVLETGEMIVEAAPVEHRMECYAYAIVEKPRPGAFQVEKAKAAGIPPGPLYAALKRGETVELPDGRIVDGRTLVGPPQPGRKIVVSGDTLPCESLVNLAREATVLVHEATFAHDQLELATRSAHSTAVQAAEIARKANARQLILTHISPRYDDEEGGITTVQMLAEAQAVFVQTLIAHDFFQYEVKAARNTV